MPFPFWMSNMMTSDNNTPATLSTDPFFLALDVVKTGRRRVLRIARHTCGGHILRSDPATVMQSHDLLCQINFDPGCGGTDLGKVAGLRAALGEQTHFQASAVLQRVMMVGAMTRTPPGASPPEVHRRTRQGQVRVQRHGRHHRRDPARAPLRRAEHGQQRRTPVLRGAAPAVPRRACRRAIESERASFWGPRATGSPLWLAGDRLRPEGSPCNCPHATSSRAR